VEIEYFHDMKRLEACSKERKKHNAIKISGCGDRVIPIYDCHVGSSGFDMRGGIV
jgi:hypothetical protein